MSVPPHSAGGLRSFSANPAQHLGPKTHSSASASSDALQANKYRASVDGPRSVSGTASLGYGRAPSQQQRPASEILSMQSMGTPETEAIDRWFEDLQHYEATLEEMAAASLDQNFKEELNAIEQWFRVLSEAERTAALYSLLQSSTSVQIRFFITVLQQMARADPNNGALLSPSNATSSMEAAQLEARIASMGFSTRPFARQSLGPNDAYLRYENKDQQRAKLSKAASHRISAPGTLSSTDRSPMWSAQEPLTEGRSPSPSSVGRPKSTSSDHYGNTFQRSSSPAMEDQLSPMLGGNWASMVNTPLVPMFSESVQRDLSVAGANSRMAGWSPSSSSQNPPMVLDDAKKFRRSNSVREPTKPNNFSPENPTTGQQAALSAQANWRNVNLGLPSSTTMSPADMANALLQQQQMMQAQLQLQQNLMMNGMMMNGLMSPSLIGQLSPSLSSGGAKRSPRPDGRSTSGGTRTPNLSSSISPAGCGATPGEPVDLSLLKDVSAWLRSLRLHKYTPNFETSTWQEMVVMDDAALEAKGVSALGARRKLLKIFENVRVATGMQDKPSLSADNDSEGGREADM